MKRTLCDNKTDVLNQSERINQSQISRATSVSVYWSFWNERASATSCILVMQEVENQTLTNKLQTAHDTGSVTHGARASSAITQPTCNKAYRHKLKPHTIWKTILKNES